MRPKIDFRRSSFGISGANSLIFLNRIGHSCRRGRADIPLLVVRSITTTGVSPSIRAVGIGVNQFRPQRRFERRTEQPKLRCHSGVLFQRSDTIRGSLLLRPGSAFLFRYSFGTAERIEGAIHGPMIGGDGGEGIEAVREVEMHSGRGAARSEMAAVRNTVAW